MRSAVIFLYELVSAVLPSTRCFPLKAFLLRLAGARLGREVRVVSGARFRISGPLSVGDGTWLGEDLLVVGGDAEVSIGGRCDIGPRVTLVTGSHVLWQNEDRAAGDGFSAPIMIGDGVWIGAGATILGGVSVGDRAMIAAGALVASDVEPDTLVAGVPARLVKRRESLV